MKLTYRDLYKSKHIPRHNDPNMYPTAQDFSGQFKAGYNTGKIGRH